MKTQQPFITASIIIAVVSIFTVGVESQQSHGQSCGFNLHCNVNSGLICTADRCACSTGPLTENIDYNMEWVTSAQMCQSRLNSACIGTEGTALPPEMKQIKCLEALTCSQIAGKPLGVGVCRSLPRLQIHGQPCSHLQHCAPAAGLICTNNVCSCATGLINDSWEYKLNWNTQRNKCVGQAGSACIGTLQNPIAEGEKNVECLTGLNCVQVPKLPLSVGLCTDERQVETTTTPTTTTAGAEGTSINICLQLLTIVSLVGANI